MRHTLLPSVALGVALGAGLAGAATVPDIVAGPDLANSAQQVEAPIDEVIVFSDRARVTRRGALAPGRGLRTLRLPDLPGSTMLNTIRMSAKGARVLRVESAPIEQDQVAIAEVEALLEAIKKIDQQLRGLDMERAVLSAEVGLLDRLTPIPPMKEGEAAQIPTEGILKRVLTFMDDRRKALDTSFESVKVRSRALHETRVEKTNALAQYDTRAFTEARIQVTAIVDVTGQRPTLSMEYFVPGATWRPDYEVEFDPSGGRLTLRTAGRVRQSTGEDWSSVRLGLSTAVPGAGIDAPELLTWTLGESRQFMPRPRARSSRQISVPLPPPAQPIIRGQQQAGQQLNELQARIRQALSGYRSGPLGNVVSGGAGGLGLRGTGAGGGGASYGKAAPARPRPKKRSRAPMSAPPPPPPPPSAPAPEPSMAYAESVAMDDGAPMAQSTSTRGPTDQGLRRRRTSLALFDIPKDTRRRRLTSPDLPAVAAGGLDFTWEAATRVVVPSGPDEQRVPLAAFQSPIDLYYEASPGISTTAYLKGEVVNGTGDPLLAGPVRLFSGGDFVGQGDIKTVGNGGKFELPLGADQDIQIVRTVTPSSRTEGVFSKSDVTVYTTKIQVANYKRRKVKIRVTDQLPKGVKEDVKIKKMGLKPDPTEGPDAEGIMRFDLELKAGGKAVVEFQYSIERPANWRLRQQ